MGAQLCPHLHPPTLPTLVPTRGGLCRGVACGAHCGSSSHTVIARRRREVVFTVLLRVVSLWRLTRNRLQMGGQLCPHLH